MNPLDDEMLLRHLERRSKTGVVESTAERDQRLWASALERLREERPQHSIWSAFRPWQPGLVAAGVVVAMALATGVLHPGTSTDSPTPHTSPTPLATGSGIQLLDADGLAALTAPDAWSTNSGRTVMVQADLAFVYGQMCTPDTDCLVGYFQGTEQVALRVNRSLVSKVDPTRPMAVAVTGEQQVDLIGSVRLPESDLAWTANGLQDAWAAIGGPSVDPAELYAVDAWLDRSGPLPCPAPPADKNGNLESSGPYHCGDAAWLAPDDTPVWKTSTDPSGQKTYEVGPPEHGIRVQNGSYTDFAPLLGAVDREGRDLPQRGLFLVRGADVDRDSCFGCEDLGVAEIVARIDPVDLSPPFPLICPNIPSCPLVVPEPTIETGTGFMLSPAELEGIAFDENSVGRVVVAEVGVVADGPAGCLLCVTGHLTGTSRSIVVFSDLPDARTDPPLAVRVLSSGAVQVLAHVKVREPGQPIWTVPEVLDLPSDQVLDSLRLVQGWLWPDPRAYACPVVPASPPATGSGCSLGDFLAATSDPLTERSQTGALEVVAGAYSQFGLGPVGQPSLAVYLVGPSGLIPPEGCSTDCPAGFRILARIAGNP